MRLTMRAVEHWTGEPWYVIERLEHDGSSGLCPVDGVVTMRNHAAMSIYAGTYCARRLVPV